MWLRSSVTYGLMAPTIFVFLNILLEMHSYEQHHLSIPRPFLHSADSTEYCLYQTSSGFVRTSQIYELHFQLVFQWSSF